jgi:hypothetical protein
MIYPSEELAAPDQRGACASKAITLECDRLL